MSIFGLAHSNFENGKISEMVSNYQTIYEDKTIGNYYQDLARILSVMKDNKSNFNELQGRLKPILNSHSKLQLLAADRKSVV